MSNAKPTGAQNTTDTRTRQEILNASLEAFMQRPTRVYFTQEMLPPDIANARSLSELFAYREAALGREVVDDNIPKIWIELTTVQDIKSIFGPPSDFLKQPQPQGKTIPPGFVEPLSRPYTFADQVYFLKQIFKIRKWVTTTKARMEANKQSYLKEQREALSVQREIGRKALYSKKYESSKIMDDVAYDYEQETQRLKFVFDREQLHNNDVLYGDEERYPLVYYDFDFDFVERPLKREILDIFIENGYINVDIVSDLGRTALDAAIRRKDEATAFYLLSRKADPKIGHTVMDAVKSGASDKLIRQLFASGAYFSPGSNFDLDLAVRLLNLMEDEREQNEFITSLFIADVEDGKYDHAKEIYEGITAFDLYFLPRGAKRNAMQVIVQWSAGDKDDLDFAQFLIDIGFDLTKLGKNGEVILSRVRSMTTLNFIVEKLGSRLDVLINKVDDFGNTPLTYAVFDRHINIDIVRRFLQLGSDPRYGYPSTFGPHEKYEWKYNDFFISEEELDEKLKLGQELSLARSDDPLDEKLKLGQELSLARSDDPRLDKESNLEYLVFFTLVDTIERRRLGPLPIDLPKPDDVLKMTDEEFQNAYWKASIPSEVLFDTTEFKRRAKVLVPERSYMDQHLDDLIRARDRRISYLPWTHLRKITERQVSNRGFSPQQKASDSNIVLKYAHSKGFLRPDQQLNKQTLPILIRGMKEDLKFNPLGTRLNGITSGNSVDMQIHKIANLIRELEAA